MYQRALKPWRVLIYAWFKISNVFGTIVFLGELRPDHLYDFFLVKMYSHRRSPCWPHCELQPSSPPSPSVHLRTAPGCGMAWWSTRNKREKKSQISIVCDHMGLKTWAKWKRTAVQMSWIGKNFSLPVISFMYLLYRCSWQGLFSGLFIVFLLTLAHLRNFMLFQYKQFSFYVIYYIATY